MNKITTAQGATILNRSYDRGRKHLQANLTPVEVIGKNLMWDRDQVEELAGELNGEPE